MQKYLSKILISMIMVAIFLAPISAGMKIKKTKAQTVDINNLLKTEIKTTFNQGKNVSVEVKIPADSIPPNNKDYNIDVVSYGCSKEITGNANKDTPNCILIERKTQKEIESSKTYTIDVKINTYNYYGIQTYIYERGNLNNTTLYLKEIDFNKNGDVDFQTNPGENNADNNITGSNNIDKSNYNDSYFNCSGLLSWTDLTCKTAYLLYFAIFVPMSSFTWLSAKLLDFFVYYSTNSSSYTGKFVNSSWAAVRDIANIFFIISLIYVAIKTILGLNVTDNKRIVGMVVIIGLIINFSLFTTKVVIDASNILAKVFYNNITSEDESGKKLDAEKGGQKSITVGLVKQFNPQVIMGNNFKGQEGLFIFITLLSIILMGFMIYIFISVSMLFVARVVSLWLSMIFSPIAFISFTLPFEIPAFGHKEWLPNLIKNAFLAPIFIFFLYIIILFGDSMKDIPYDISSTGGGVGGYLDAAMKDIIPFSIVFILLLKSKELAVKFSGEIGQAVVKGAAVVGGLALGGAGMGMAALGRGTVGAVAKSVQNDTARKKDFETFGGYKNWSTSKKFNPFAYMGQAKNTIVAAAATGIHNIPTFKKDSQGNTLTLGARMKEADEGYGHKTHAKHILDAKMQSEFGHEYGKDAKYKDLTEHDQKIVKQEVDKDEMAKFVYGKQFKDLEAKEAKEIQEKYNKDERPIVNDHGKTTEIRKVNTGEKTKSDYFVDVSKTNSAMGEFVQALRKGSYDVRNLPNAKMNSKGFVPKLAVGIIAAVATGMKVGLKKSLGVDVGTPQKDLFKDLGNIISESLKSANISVGEKSHSGDSGHKEVKSVGH